jgi:hypothetical protein
MVVPIVIDPRMCRDHLQGFGLLGDPKPPERNRATPAFQYRTQRGIPVRLKPLSLTRPTAIDDFMTVPRSR